MDSLPLYPRVILDGIDTGSEVARIQDTFAMLEPSQVLAMEVYMGPAQIPLQYGGTNSPCGVIIIWTKH